MRNIADTLARLNALRSPGTPGALYLNTRLSKIEGFGSNPGALRGYIYVPQGLKRNAALVVVLHGCTQTAAGYDHGSGWSQMADRYGFAVLFAEQQKHNNPHLCFNWFLKNDRRRGHGEALSIRQMVAAAVQAQSIDLRRIFVTGLSAGGAMACVMLATYPEVFAGGAIIAGLPYGCASTVPEAFDRMRGHGMPADAELVASVKNASEHSASWPTLSIWHGTNDMTVSAQNASAICSQWSALHSVGDLPNLIEEVDGHPRRVWRDLKGRDVIEEYSVLGMGHGTPLGTMTQRACGEAGPLMLEAGISSTYHICRFWGLAEELEDSSGLRGPDQCGQLLDRDGRDSQLIAADGQAIEMSGRVRPAYSFSHRVGSAEGVRKIIEDALRAVGLMR